MTQLQALLFVIASLAVPVAGTVIFLYLRASFRLLDLVQSAHPELWRSLGSPERVFVRQQFGGVHSIQPLFPWLSWVWSGSARGLDLVSADQLRRTRRLLRGGIVALLLAFAAILLLIAEGP